MIGGILLSGRDLRRESLRTCPGIHISSGGGNGVPFVGIRKRCLHAQTVLVQHSQVELRVGQSESGCGLEPMRRLGEVLLDTGAIGIGNAEVIHGLYVSMRRGLQIPACGLLGIGGDADSFLIAHAELELREAAKSWKMDTLLVPSRTDPKGRIVSFNSACERATGYRRAEVIGKSIWDLLIPPEQHGDVEEVFSLIAPRPLMIQSGSIDPLIFSSFPTKALSVV